jgi:tRNA (Thr-GGU) A37 N-methylase
LISIRENILHIENVDILDGTPLLDIKPYIPDFDSIEEVRIGWLKNSAQNVKNHRSDQRFK